jgi:hypothetical protein
MHTDDNETICIERGVGAAFKLRGGSMTCLFI